MPQRATGNLLQGQTAAPATVVVADVSKCLQLHIKPLGHLQVADQCYKKGKLIKHISCERNWGICSWQVAQLAWMLQEFAPKLPTVPGVTQNQLSNRTGSAHQLFCYTLLSNPLIRELSNVGEWTTAVAYTINLILLIICTSSLPLEETLNCVISAQTWRDSTESSNYNCLDSRTLTSMRHTNSHAVR